MPRRFALYAFLILLPLSASAQKGEDRGMLIVPALPAGVIQATDGLNAVTVGQIREMTDEQLRDLQDLCRNWADLIAVEQKRRKK